MEPQPNKQTEEAQFKVLTSALMNAIGIGSSEEGQKAQSINIFLTKIYKKNVSAKQAKLNEIRLRRLNAFLYKMVNNFPAQTEAIEIIKNTIIGFLSNQTNFENDIDPFTLKTGHWIAKMMQIFASTDHFKFSIELLQMLLHGKTPAVLSEQKFEEIIKSSKSFVDEQIRKEDEVNANKRMASFSLFQEIKIFQYILNEINCEALFQKLFEKSEEKTMVVEKFIEYCQVIDVENVKHKFIHTFILGKINSQAAVEAVLKGAESNLFHILQYDDIVKIIFKETENNRNLLFKLRIKDLKCENRYLELIMEEIKGKSVVEMVQCFMNSPGANNYYLLYLIHKSEQKIPESFTNMVFHPQKFTNRHAIICAFSIFQNENQYKKLLELFFTQEQQLTLPQKVNVLKLIQFSLQNVTKSQFFSQILRNVPASSLDLESTLQFLPIICQDKKNITKEEMEQVSQLLNRFFGNTQTIYKIKLDLYPVCGKKIPYLPDLQKVTTLFEMQTEAILSELPNVKEDNLQVALMGINNKIREQFMMNQSISPPTIEWALSIHKKEMKNFANNVGQELKKIGKQDWQHLAITLFEYNFERGTDLCFDENIRPITSMKMIQNLKGNDFSEYFISLYSEKVEKYSSILKPKSILIQLRKLLRILPNSARQNSKKELKTILSEEAPALFALKIIQNINNIGIRNFENIEAIKQILKVMLKQLKPEYEYFDDLERRASTISIQYCSIFQNLPKLFKEIHIQTMNFTAALMSSKVPSVDEKKKKTKKKENPAENDEQRIVSILSSQIRIIFGDPNAFESYENLLKIIDKISKAVNKKQLSYQLIRWLSKLKIFHRDSFKEWKKKVFNLAHLWEVIVNLVSGVISVSEKERHFLIVTDLLNTLYEMYRKEENMIEVEQILLEILLLIFKLKCEDSMEMEEETIKVIPLEKIRNVLTDQHLSILSEPHYFQCIDCGKQICNLQADFIHRLHDKVYLGSSGSCEHGGKQRVEKEEREERRESKERQIRQKYLAIKELRERDRHIERERDFERYTLSRFVEGDNLAEAEEMMFQLQLRQKILDSEMRLEELELKKNKDSEAFSKLEDDEEEGKQGENDKKMEIRSCSEKQFLIRPSMMRNAVPSIPPPEYRQHPFKPQKEKINLNPLFKLLIRQLTSNNFLTVDHFDLTSKRDNDDPLFKVDIDSNKMAFFRADIFKNQQLNQLPYNSAYGSYRGFDVGGAMPRRNVLSLSDRHLAINGGVNVLAFSFATLRNRYAKKESEKKYKEVEPYEGYLLNRNANSQNPIIQIAFSPHSKAILAVVTQSRLTFEVYSNSDGRIQKVFGGENNYGRIQKFQWIKGGKNMFALLNRQLNFGLVHKNLEVKRLSRIQLNRTCKDFAVSIGSKGANVIMLDVDGKLYQSFYDIQDITHNQIHNLTDKIVTFPPIAEGKILSLHLHEFYLIGTLKNGSIVIFDLMDNGTISPNYTVVPFMQKMGTVSAANEYPKVKEFNLLTNIRVIYKTANELFFTCIFAKEQSITEGKNFGNFVIWKYNLKKKKSNIIVFNDQGMTNSYDFSPSGEKEWLLFCLQEDGEVWSTKFSPIKTSIHDDEFKVQMIPKSVSQYAKKIQSESLFDEIIDYENDRRPVYKIHNVITEYFLISSNNGWNIKHSDQYQYGHFISGISFYVDYPQNATEPLELSFTCLGRKYHIMVSKNREVQIPFTLKETMKVFFDCANIQIKLNDSSKFEVKNVTIHGFKWDEKSVFYHVLQKIYQLYTIYRLYGENEIHPYLLNETRADIASINIQDLIIFMNKKKYNRAEINLLMKLQLLRQSTTQSIQISPAQLKEYYHHIRQTILPFSNDKQILSISIQKLCEKFTKIVPTFNKQRLKLGHPLHYRTHFDIYDIFTKYSTFVSEQTLETYECLIKKLVFLSRERVDNFYLAVACWPKLINEIGSFYRKIIGQYKNYFKISDKGMDKHDKMKMIRLCKSIVLLICESYYVEKNRQNKKAQKNLLSQLESIFCITNRQFYKELYLNPFQFMEPIWESNSFPVHAPFNYFQMPPFKEDLYIQSVEFISNPVPVIDHQIVPQQPQRSLFEDQAEISDEEHKMEEENREMEGEEQVEFYGHQVNDLKVEEMLGEQNQSEEKSDINKIYEGLFKQMEEGQEGWYTLVMRHSELCENIILELFTNSDYLTEENAVFYMGMLYNLLLVLQNKKFKTTTLENLFKAIDERIYDSNYSVLFMALNMFMEVSYIQGVVVGSTTKICKLLLDYYQKNKNSNFIKCISNEVDWQGNNQSSEKPVSLNSVITLQIFNIKNQAYQLKFIGNLFLNLRAQNYEQFTGIQTKIKTFVLKVVVKYGLRVYKNIMLSENWVGSLEQTKVDVAFERVIKNKNKKKAIEMIRECVKNSLDVYVKSLNEHPERIENLEKLLGSGENDEELLELLNAYYSKQN